MSGEAWNAQRVFVTGGAGFIGSTAVDRLLADGCDVVAYDNFSTGHRGFLTNALSHPRFRLVEGDTLDLAALTEAMRGSELVLHFAANADVRFGVEHPRKDLEQNTIATFNVLEAMRAMGVRRIAFASTGAIYGEPSVFPTPEDAPFPIQTSLYAASKLAGEGMIGAYSHGYGFTGLIFRLAPDSIPEVISRLMVSRWAVDALGTSVNINRFCNLPNGSPLAQNCNPPLADLFPDAFIRSPEHLRYTWLILLLFIVGGIAITTLLLKLKDRRS
jgi:nucleoside-diphosphate-sugar epimerase